MINTQEKQKIINRLIQSAIIVILTIWLTFIGLSVVGDSFALCVAITGFTAWFFHLIYCLLVDS